MRSMIGITVLELSANRVIRKQIGSPILPQDSDSVEVEARGSGHGRVGPYGKRGGRQMVEKSGRIETEDQPHKRRKTAVTLDRRYHKNSQSTLDAYGVRLEDERGRRCSRRAKPNNE